MSKSETLWEQLCADAGVDPQQRLAARRAILADPQALECSLYRSSDEDPDAEEEDLGDARILLLGPFTAPANWDAEQHAAFFEDLDARLFYSAKLECLAEPGTSGFFVPEVGDYLAVTEASGKIQMYFLHDWQEEVDGCHCVLVRDDIVL